MRLVCAPRPKLVFPFLPQMALSRRRPLPRIHFQHPNYLQACTVKGRSIGRKPALPISPVTLPHRPGNSHCALSLWPRRRLLEASSWAHTRMTMLSLLAVTCFTPSRAPPRVHVQPFSLLYTPQDLGFPLWFFLYTAAESCSPFWGLYKLFSHPQLLQSGLIDGNMV